MTEMRMTPSWIGTLAAASLLAALSACGAAAPQQPDPFAPAAVLSTVETLCGPGMDGRLSGSPGYGQAVEVVSARFAELGLEPAGDDGYCQRAVMELNEITATPTLRVVGRDEALVAGRDFVARGFSGSGQLTAPVVFVGYGLSMPELGYDDYAGVDVAGAVVLSFKDAPPWTPEGGAWGDAHLPRPKARVAAEHGAVALLLVSDPDAPYMTVPFASVLHGPGEQDPGFPQLHLAIPVAEQLVGPAEGGLKGLKARLDEQHRPQSRVLGVAVELAVDARHVAAQSTCNVVAVLRGSATGDEHVVIGAHLDHVGRQGGLVFPGANDNASGVAGVLAAAEAFARRGTRPERNVVFALFAGEEQGLLGAKAYVEHPALPLEACVAMLNLDCIGDGTALKIGSGQANPELWELARAIDARTDKRLVEETWYGGGADAQPFFDAGVPTLYFDLADGYHHIHRATDTPDTLDPTLLAATARLAFLTAAAVADGEYSGEPRRPPTTPSSS